MKKDNYAISPGRWSPAGPVLEKRSGPGLFEYLEDGNIIQYKMPIYLSDEEIAHFNSIENEDERKSALGVYKKLTGKVEPMNFEYLKNLVDRLDWLKE